VEATAEVTGASVDNLKFLRDRKTDLAFTTGDTLAEAVNGSGPFQGARLPVQAIATLYINYSHLVTLASSPVRSVGDLKGRTISTGAAGSGTEVTSFRIMKASGLDPESDIRRQSLSPSQAADALKDGKIDAFFWNGGLPTAAILDLAHTPGVKIRLIDHSAVLDQLKQAFGDSLYLRGTIPKTAYAGMDADVGVISVNNILAVHEDMDPEIVYAITRALFEHQPALEAIHPEARKLSLRSAVAGSAAPYHPGAIRYYRERNVWSQ
jgi:TRAP transporter TAXI family solute receptor